MINRRTFLVGTVGLMLSSSLASCSRAAKSALNITLLEGSVPAEVLKQFRKQMDEPVSFQSFLRIKSIFQQLQIWQQEPEASGFSIGQFLPWVDAEEAAKPDDLVSLGDYWLSSAIAQNLIEPLDIPAKSLEKIPPSWQQFVRRDSAGKIAADTENTSLWAAPYKVQTLVIVYRKNLFPKEASDSAPFKSWRDLLQPQLAGKIALPDHPRIVIGLLQKMQGGSFNSVIEASDDNLEAQLIEPFTQLNQQVKTYDSENSLKALINGDVSAIVSWSGDVASALRRYQELRVVVPEEGSLLSADMWVRPKGTQERTQMSKVAQKWIDFCWQAGPAAQISVSGKGLSPIFLKAEASLPESLSNGLLSVTAMRKSEPLLPIPEALQASYFELWKQLRTG